ncbi:MAG: SMP-30/gluconolactonase/LRE family protein [Fibrobacter sp.]|jgi:gluconolactonase|nr:SMP-30/gluconolactonase/LRE family protein [Fibrobacter sp.]
MYLKKTFSIFITLFFAGSAFSHTIDLPPSLVAPGEEIKTIKSGINFGEGPAADSEDNLYFTDRDPSRIWKITPQGTATVFRNDANGANGMVFDPEDHLIVCEKNGLTRIKRDGTVTTLFAADTFGSEGPNDLTLTSNGSIFFTSSVWNSNGKVYFWDSETKTVKTILSFTNPPNYPNGIEFIESKKLLYLNITQKDSVLKYQVNDDMSVTKIGGFCRTPSPDGLAIDSNGNLWIANTNGNRTVTVFDSTGAKLGSISIDGQQSIQNCAFGGLDKKTLYITGKTAVFSLRTLVAGRSTTGEIPVKVIGNGKERVQRGKHFTNKGNASLTLWSIDGKLIGNYRSGNSEVFTKSMISQVLRKLPYQLNSGAYIYSLRQDGVELSGIHLFRKTEAEFR